MEKVEKKTWQWENPDESLEDYVGRMKNNGVYIDHYLERDIVILPMFDKSVHIKPESFILIKSSTKKSYETVPILMANYEDLIFSRQ